MASLCEGKGTMSEFNTIFYSFSCVIHWLCSVVVLLCYSVVVL